MSKTNKLEYNLTQNYDYLLPPRLIASYPVTPVDDAKLLIYSRKKDKITHTIFKNLLDFIPKDTSIFFNDTKVIKARIFGNKQSGGKVELLLNKPMPRDQFLVYIKGKVKVKSILNFDKNLSVLVVCIFDDGSRLVECYQDGNKLDFIKLVEILNQIGHIPLPPYINRVDTKKDEVDYQTLFAKNNGAVASPTASLHFTPYLLDKLKSKFNTAYLTLHIGAGTFKPVEVSNISNHKIHSEIFKIPPKTIELLSKSQHILAVGTTVTRTIEFYQRTKKSQGECDLFLNPSNPPQLVNHLLTNFHLPKSTLIMLVASFVGLEKTLEIYNIAIKQNYRFYSYGDGMLII